MRALLSIALVLVLATLAGCASKSADPASTASVASDPNASPKDAISAANATANVTTITMTPVMIAYQGTSPQGACTLTGTPADQCQFSSTGSESFHKIDYKGTATHIAVQITYPSQQPTFAMYAAVCIAKPGAPITSNDCKDYKTKPSPMVIDMPLKDLAPGTQIGLSIGAVSESTGPAPVLVFGQSDFKVQGALTTIAA